MESIPLILLRWWIIPIFIVGVTPTSNPHNFSSAASHGNIGCVACHHPHKAGGKAALWEPSLPPERRLGLYVTLRTQAGEISLMCLGCHDGAIAPDIPADSGTTIAGQVGNSTAGMEIGAAAETGVGYPLSSHPIGVRYPLHADQFVSRATVEARGFRLPDNRVECVSCHDPHGTTGVPHLLVKSNRRSALCLSCHQL